MVWEGTHYTQSKKGGGGGGGDTLHPTHIQNDWEQGEIIFSIKREHTERSSFEVQIKFM